jgi:hypothetical protein
MEPIEGSETSAFKSQTPGKYPKENAKTLSSINTTHISTRVILPRKMEPIEGSETSAFKPQTPGEYPKENTPHD